MNRLRRATGPGAVKERYIKLTYWMMDSAAWRDLRPPERAAYLELARRYNGFNNGRIPFSLDEMKDAIHVGKTTAMRIMAALEDHWFTVCTFRGHFDRKLQHASEWLLTEFADDRNGMPATKEFMKWRPTNAGDRSNGGKSRQGTGNREVPGLGSDQAGLARGD